MDRSLLNVPPVSTNLPSHLLSHLHERLAQKALQAPPRLTGKTVAKLALELALKQPLTEAITAAIKTIGGDEMAEPHKAERVCALAMKLVFEGLRIDDALAIALHEPTQSCKTSAPMPEPLKRRMFPAELTGANVLKYAVELNASGIAMDDAIIEGLHKFAGARTITHEQAEAVLDEAQKLFKEGRAPAEAFDLALRRTLPKHD